MEALQEAEERCKAPCRRGHRERYAERHNTDGDGRHTRKREDRQRHHDELRVLRSAPRSAGEEERRKERRERERHWGERSEKKHEERSARRVVIMS